MFSHPMIPHWMTKQSDIVYQPAFNGKLNNFCNFRKTPFAEYISFVSNEIPTDAEPNDWTTEALN